MTTTDNTKRVTLASMAYIIIILAGVKIATPILVPFLLSLFLVIITKPFYDALHAKGLPGWLVFTIILVVILLFDLLLVFIISASVDSFSNNISFYNEKLNEYRKEISRLSARLGIKDTHQLDTLFDPKRVMGFIAGTLSSFSDILSNGILILLTVIFIFIESKIFPDKVKAIARNQENIRYFNVINHQINQYMMIKTYVSLGTGVITTAAKAELGSPESLSTAIRWMSTLNREAAEILKELSPHAVTDVTGFGLVGHAAEMAEASGLAITIELEGLPLMPGALDAARTGLVPAGTGKNRESVETILIVADGADPILVDLALDPQTSGGLLAALPSTAAEGLVRRLSGAAIVGRVLPGEAGSVQLV